MPSSLACAAERWCASSITKCSVCSPATVASETCTRPVAPISSMDMAPAMPLPHMSKWNLTVPVRRRKGLQESVLPYSTTALPLPYHCLTTALLLTDDPAHDEAAVHADPRADAQPERG